MEKVYEEILSGNEQVRNSDEAVMELALLAGSILLENGAEIFRVEETIQRICAHYGIYSDNAYVLSNGIFVTAGSPREHLFAKVKLISVGGTHLDRVVAVNQLSREITTGKYTVEEAMERMLQIREMPVRPAMTQFLASAVTAAAFCIMFGGSIWDCLVAWLTGFVLYIFVYYIGAKHLSKIVRNVIGGLIISLVCGFFYSHFKVLHLNYMIIGSLMPLVPGMAFTNGIRDIADSDYLSGSVRMLDALLVFISIAAGVGMGCSFLALWTGGRYL